ncbi:hypothetical protein cypCar_00014519 [Cyprinus carpio]|nr:hypothetical protein cypCar_00014519 [Cyprinus carpio]
MDPTAKYISQKISRTRWRPVPAGLLQQPEVFAAGSWDNEAGDEFSVSIWSLGDDDSDTDGEFDEEPRLLCDSEHDGDVTDLQLSLQHIKMKLPLYLKSKNISYFTKISKLQQSRNKTHLQSPFLDGDRLVSASSSGAVAILKLQPDCQALSLAHVWERAHRYSCDNAPCTAVVCRSPELVSVGEDGRVILYKADQTEVVRVIGGWNSRVVSHSGVPLAGEDDSVVSSWLAGDSSKNRLEATHMLPSQTLSVNSLDVLEQCLVCGTDGEAVYVHRQLPV